MKKPGFLLILPATFLVISCCQLWNYFGPTDGYSLDDKGNSTPTWFCTDNATIAHWTFDQKNNDTIADISGNGHLAKMFQNPAIVAGRKGNALHCEANYCTSPHSVDFYPPLLTVEAAVKLSSYPGSDMSPRPHMMIISTVDWSGDFCKGYELRLSGTDGKVEFIFGDDHWWHYAVSEKRLPLNEWHSIAGQYDGKRISVYVDGELWAETFYESTIRQCETDFGIGRRLVDQPFYFNGSIDEIAVSKVIRYK